LDGPALSTQLAFFVLEPVLGTGIRRIPSEMPDGERGRALLRAAVVISTSHWSAPPGFDAAECAAIQLNMAKQAAAKLAALAGECAHCLPPSDVARLHAASRALQGGWESVAGLLERD
jgi:hypothetical protein